MLLLLLLVLVLVELVLLVLLVVLAAGKNEREQTKERGYLVGSNKIGAACTYLCTSKCLPPIAELNYWYRDQGLYFEK